MDRYDSSFSAGDDDLRGDDLRYDDRESRRRARHDRRGGCGDPEGDLRQRAVHRIRARRNLAVGVIVYVLINGMLVTVWARNGGGFFWPIFPIAFWGIGLFWQLADAFGRGASEDRIQAEMRRLSGEGR
ncbi:hypothetical protein DEO23_09660 [Brachybacterium endophyticum]|uniref:2TM domain-containing protein n=1 Tax=Brachybacterium endophyticum TaxID=2182385 RepID=A0A2U2RJN5_9MICO|nr:2TM domain-containing protein [Brachybacterium endophyticum]PWH06070.1 hypothetical protein DEO23_09660 [Brachybacterium endophyticum]